MEELSTRTFWLTWTCIPIASFLLGMCLAMWFINPYDYCPPLWKPRAKVVLVAIGSGFIWALLGWQFYTESGHHSGFRKPLIISLPIAVVSAFVTGRRRLLQGRR